MTFLITGANRGIGLELCQFALENGHRVYALVRNPKNSRYLAQEKKAHPDTLSIIETDVTSAEDLENAKEILGDTEIDILVNNAGIMTNSDEGFERLTHDDFLQTFAVNAFAPFHVARIFLANLKRSTNPKLINITSMMGSIDDNKSGGYYAYRMSKCALNMFNRSFSIDHPEIIALTLHPGWVRTDMGGSAAPLLPRESARGLYKVITSASPEQSGRFYDYQGNELRW